MYSTNTLATNQLNTMNTKKTPKILPCKKYWCMVDITKPIEGYIVVGPSWHLCIDGDPTRALFYMGFPQRNVSKDAVDRLMTAKVYKAFTNVSAVFLELSYSPIHPKE